VRDSNERLWASNASALYSLASGRTSASTTIFYYHHFSHTLGRCPERDLRARDGRQLFLRSGTSTYQRSYKINFFTITDYSTHAFHRAVCSFAVGEKYLCRLLADTSS
jgi:hypothetical protein